MTNRPTGEKKNYQIFVVFIGDSACQEGNHGRRAKGTVAVTHRSAHMGHCRTQSVLQRRVPHRSHLARPLRSVQLTKTSQPRIGIWLKGKRAMLWTQPRHTLTRCGMHFRNTQMGQCNGFQSRLWQSVRIFTTRL